MQLERGRDERAGEASLVSVQIIRRSDINFNISDVN